MKILIYTTKTCIYCNLAKKLLEENNLQYNEIDVENDIELFRELIKITNNKTVPKIFINDTFIGGYTELCNFITKKK